MILVLIPLVFGVCGVGLMGIYFNVRYLARVKRREIKLGERALLRECAEKNRIAMGL